MNKVILVGNVGRDPEFKHLDSGGVIANFSLATREWGGKEKGEFTEWHRLVAFGKIAETVEKYVTKGRSLCIEGRLQTRSWEKDGTKRYMTETVVNRLEFAGPKPQKNTEADQSDLYEDDDDVPF